MPLLVDGDNLLGRWPGRERSQGERVRLTHELQRASQSLGNRIHVCFDGSKPKGIGVASQSYWSGAGQSADDWIVSFLHKQKDPQSWTVITDDRALGDRCRWVGAQQLGCRKFRLRLESKTSEKPEREKDVLHWMEVFGKDQE